MKKKCVEYQLTDIIHVHEGSFFEMYCTSKDRYIFFI